MVEFFKKISYFVISKNCVFAKKIWLDFLTNNIFKIHSILKLLTTLLKSFLAIFSQRYFNKTYIKYTQSLKLLLATVAKSSCVAKF